LEQYQTLLTTTCGLKIRFLPYGQLKNRTCLSSFKKGYALLFLIITHYSKRKEIVLTSCFQQHTLRFLDRPRNVVLKIDKNLGPAILEKGFYIGRDLQDRLLLDKYLMLFNLKAIWRPLRLLFMLLSFQIILLPE